MRVASTPTELERALGRSGSIALVPTMGALHAGHAALIRAARRRCDAVVVSIFVNPLQFNQSADLEAYPRTLDADLATCRDLGVDVAFTPTVQTMYPDGEPVVRLWPGALGDDLEGASRPGHFAGVLSVVVKLFGLVRPQVAVFGDKDFQQLAVVRRMVTDLCLPTEVVGVETVREDDGLALSSRNVHLSPDERRSALALSRALEAGSRESTPDAVLAAASEVLRAEPGIRVDYLDMRAPDLGPAPDAGEARLLVAADVGSTRLIDNRAVNLGGAT